MSLFRKPKKSIQRRVFSANDDDDYQEKIDIDSSDIPNPPPAPKIKKPDKKEKISQNKQTLLSFGDEEGEEVFQVKKSSQSKKIMKLLDKERRKKEKTVKNQDTKTAANTDINNLVKEINKPSNLLMEKMEDRLEILNGRAALCAGKDDVSDSDEENDNLSRPIHKFSRADNQNSTGSKVDNFKVILESGQIPDAAMIHAARKKRQRARELGGQSNNPDVISIQENESNDIKIEKETKGRLVRERDEDFSDEERIDMNVNLAAKEMDSRREQFYASQGQESEHDTDKEMEEWENQQIRKGVTGAQLMAASQESMYGQITTEIKSEFIHPEVIHEPGDLRTPESIVGKLKERLQVVKSSLHNHETDLNKVILERDQIEQELLNRERKGPEAAEKFRFYQELRGYVTDLVECLDEKISEIYGIEQKALDLMASQAVKLIERRRQDVRDQAEEYSSQQRPGLKLPEDEKKTRRAAEREGRRNRRRRLRENENQKYSTNQNQIKTSHFEGMSSDDEISDLEKLNFEKFKESIISEKNEIFSDVVEDFYSLKKILEHFQNWKNHDENSYNESYVALVIPKILGPFLRLEILFWNPLTENLDFDKLDFYKNLMTYGANFDQNIKIPNKNDPDTLLVPNIIDKIFIPKLSLIVEKLWDPLSGSQNLRLISIISKFIRKYPTLAPDSKNLTTLFTQIVEKFQNCIENDVFIPIFNKKNPNLDPKNPNLDSKIVKNPNESKNPFFQRQFHSALKLLKNISSWQSLISDKILKNLALSLILNRYLLSAVHVCNLTDGVSKLNLISHSLPRIWLNGETKELGPFNNCVLKFGSQLDKDNPLHLESIEIISTILKSLKSNA